MKSRMYVGVILLMLLGALGRPAAAPAVAMTEKANLAPRMVVFESFLDPE